MTAVFAASGAGVAAVGKAAQVQHVSSVGREGRVQEGAVLKPALKYLFALGWIGGTKNRTQCGLTLLGKGAARDQAADGIRKNSKLRAQLAKRAISVRRPPTP